MQKPLPQQSSARSKLETIHNLIKVDEDKDENMDDDTQKPDTICVSTEKQSASTSTEEASHSLLLGTHKMLAI